MRSLVEYDIHSLEAELSAMGEKPSHARKILRAFYAAKGKPAWAEIEISKRLREILQSTEHESSRILQAHQSGDDTVKLLIGFDEQPSSLVPESGATKRALHVAPSDLPQEKRSVEAVLMPAYRPDRAAACVSSQIGCAMGCDFCASTRGGLVRNLTAVEIVEQFLHLSRQAAEIGRRITSLVFMGMGEPMHNLPNVIAAIRRIADPDMGGLGWRQITVSTVGIVPGIDALADADLNVHLALSLHAPDDETRSRIVPAGKRYGVLEILSATRRFEARTGRIPTIEYCLLAGVNDSDAQATKLADLLTDPTTGFRAHVNLIPYNAIGPGLGGASYERPSLQRMETFAGILSSRGVITHFRRTRGDDVAAACGQLRAAVV